MNPPYITRFFERLESWLTRTVETIERKVKSIFINKN